MILKKRYKIRLTKFGKLFFSGIFGLTVLILGLAFINHQRVFYEKDENKNYIVEINYPKVKSKQLLAYTDDYIKNKKKEFKEEISKEEPLNSSKYEFKADYKVTDNNNILGLHLNISEYTGGAHHIRYDKSYYYNKESDEIVSIKDFLEKDTSLDKLANLSYYYVMKYSDDNNLNFDKEGVKEGLSFNLNNFEHFNFIDDGLEFIFPPYQIAYYAAGEIKIVIPYDELNGIIKNKYLKYSEKNNIKQDNNRNLKEFSNKKLIAFTFDDGPSYIGTNKLLDNLDKYNARVTFFVLGSRVENYKDTLTKAYKMGNTIGNHTYSHSNLLKLDNYSVMDEIKKTNETIKNITGSEAIYLRPPYGNINSDIKNISNMYTILWDLDTEDWKNKDKDRIADYIISNAHDGAIVLLHDLYETSVDGALLAMERLEKEGYAFVTIDEMIKIKDIQLDINKNYYQIK